MHSVLKDFRHGLRLFRRSPGFALVAVTALAIGIGASTAIFSVVDGVLLRPLPYPDSTRLMMLYEKTPEFDAAMASYPNFLDWRRESRSFADMAAFSGDNFRLSGSGEPVRLLGEWASASLLPVLGVNPLLGRNFLPEEDRQGGAPVVILTYSLWKERFGGNPAIVGQALTLNGKNYTVIGVLPADFHFRPAAALYVPIGQSDPQVLGDRALYYFRVVGRLKAGVTPEGAQAEIASVGRELASRFPNQNAGRGVTLIPLRDDEVGHIQSTLWLLLGAVGFVLLIACVNVANLLLARSTGRRREFAIRAALGADRKRVLRQLLTESVLLALAGAAVGLLLAFWGTRLVVAAVPGTLPRSRNIGLDPVVLTFTLAVAVLTGILFGLAPAFRSSQANPQEALREGERAGGGRYRVEGFFVIAEVGLAVVLLAGAGLMIQSLQRLWHVDPGFNPQAVLTMKVALSSSATSSVPRLRRAFEDLLDRVREVPGVQSDALIQILPLAGIDTEVPFWLGTGPQPPPDHLLQALFYTSTPDYLRVMDIPLLQGRFFTEQDTTSVPTVVVIDDVMAHNVFPNQDPIGRQITMEFLGQARIVGVVRHVKHWGLDADDTAKVRSELYFAFQQIPDRWFPTSSIGMTLALRTASNPLGVVSAVRERVAGPGKDQPAYNVQTMETIVSDSMAERRFTLMVLEIFAGAALLLASVGIYGVMSYSVSRRTRELGVRLALGATRADVLRLVVREGMVLAGIGLAAGLAAAVALTRLLASLLYGVRTTDPLTLAGVTVLLAGVAFLASYLPARRAAHVEPTAALRCE